MVSLFLFYGNKKYCGFSLTINICDLKKHLFTCGYHKCDVENISFVYKYFSDNNAIFTLTTVRNVEKSRREIVEGVARGDAARGRASNCPFAGHPTRSVVNVNDRRLSKTAGRRGELW